MSLRGTASATRQSQGNKDKKIAAAFAMTVQGIDYNGLFTCPFVLSVGRRTIGSSLTNPQTLLLATVEAGGTMALPLWLPHFPSCFIVPINDRCWHNETTIIILACKRMLKKIDYPSPNFEPRPPNLPIDLIVLHYTDMRTAEEALARLCDAEAKVSAHYLISKEGTLYQLVDPIYRAWHAGVSSWQGEKDINSRSIGIELDNFGHAFGPEPFPAAQIDTLIDLLGRLTKTYGISPQRIVGHSDVAPLRKSDPGELFPWAELAKKGFGLWPCQTKPALPLPSLLPMDTLEMQRALSDIGYGCSQTGVWDEDTQKVCRAFQQHFTPHELTGYPSDETRQMLQALLKVVKNQPLRN